MLPPASKRRVNPLLIKVIVISVILHVVIGLILGGITVINHIIPEKAQFEEAPETPEEAPPPPPVKIDVKPQKPKQVLTPKLNLKPVSNIAVADVNVDLPDMQQNFTVSSGLGAGSLRISGGKLLGGANGRLKLGMSEVNVFGIKSKSERILFVINSSRQMVTDAKGGLNSYKVIKDKVTELISNLAPGTLFNVILYNENNLSALFQPKLVSAGIENQAKLIKWFAPINADIDNIGIEKKEISRRPLTFLANSKMVENLMATDGLRTHNQNAYLTQLALEMNVDSVFHICGDHNGFDGARQRKNTNKNKSKNKTSAERKKDPNYEILMAAHKAEIPIMMKRIYKELDKQNAARKKKGLPPKVFRGTDIYSQAKELGFEWKNEKPSPSSKYIREKVTKATKTTPTFIPLPASKVEQHLKQVALELYTKKKKRVPSINIVLLLAGGEKLDDDKKKSIDKFTRTFKGKLRILKGFNAIKSAAGKEK